MRQKRPVLAVGLVAAAALSAVGVARAPIAWAGNGWQVNVARHVETAGAIPAQTQAQTPRKAATRNLVRRAQGPALAASAAAGVPKPGQVKTAPPLVQPSPAEAEHNARIDAILEPLLAHVPAPEDIERLKTAFQAIAGLEFQRAQEIEAQIADPAAKKLVRWAIARSDALYLSPAEIEAFRTANPDFPDQSTMRQRAEEALLTRTSDPRAIRAFFEKSPPQSGAGHAALAAALMAEGKTDKAREHAAKAWREHDFPARIEELIANTFASLLTEADHKFRFDRIVMKDSRWQKERADRAALARRTMKHLSEPGQKKARAQLAVFLREKGAAALITALPAEAMKDWGVYFAVVQLARRAGNDADEDETAKGEGESQDPVKQKEAWRLMRAAPVDAALIVSPDDWWIERRVNAYAALRMGQPKIAYDLVRNPGALSINPAKDAQMMAGWIALRHLLDVKAAERHFKDMRQSSDGPISSASAEYWLARTYQQAGDMARAAEHFKKAAPYYDTFYGQLARQTLDPNASKVAIPPPPAPTDAEKARFVARDSVRALLIARRAGLESVVRPYLAHLRYHLIRSPGELVLAAHLASALGDTQFALRTGKAAIAANHNLAYYAYPTHAFPAYQPLRPPPETAFLFSIARQESEFNTLITSGAGARGVLQVMPITARHICRDYKIKCDIPRLTTDPAYNTMLASAYIGDRMQEFSGNYLMTLAGYNAGPGRVRQWMREFGDPRSPNVDPVDWIERIPFEETREYVKKVLSNIQVYRSRLGEEDSALQILADLRRTRATLPQPAPQPAAAPAPAPPPAEARPPAPVAAEPVKAPSAN